jgi:hypothetical protein
LKSFFLGQRLAGVESPEVLGSEEKTMPVSFATHIRPLFRDIDIQHMKSLAVYLDDYSYMSDAVDDHSHAQSVEDRLRQQSMPPGGPYWTAEQLALFAQWRSEGYLP